MKKIVFVSLLVFSLSFNGSAQLNGFKYVIVPKKFSAFKNMNEFQTSTLIKFLFDKADFNVVYDDNLPDDLKDDPCLGALLDLEDESNLFATKTRLLVRDCEGKFVFGSIQGKSKLKDFKKSYQEAITEAFASFKGMEYAYDPELRKKRSTEGRNTEEKSETESETVTVSFKDDVKNIDEVEERDVNVMPESTENQTPTSITTGSKGDKDILYAQPVAEGYQLVDSSPAVVYALRATSSPDIFMVTKDGKNGIVYKSGEKWFLEMDGKSKKATELKIKF
ncbi:MAG: hypothetical protein HRT65_01525 [Flavobacteriaceae bacterium]|nr:hypothetical protein [Flavobacteriaceae bacterium]